MQRCSECGKDLSDVTRTPEGAPCPQCGSFRRDGIAAPSTLQAKASVPTPPALGGSRWSGEGLTLLGIWYGTVVAISGVAAAGHRFWPAIYAGASLILGLVIFWLRRRFFQRLMGRYFRWMEEKEFD
jgi:hypothetical protein